MHFPVTHAQHDAVAREPQSRSTMHASPHAAGAPQTSDTHRGHVELMLHTPSLPHFVPHAPLHFPLTHFVQYGNAYVPHSPSAAHASPQYLPFEHFPATQFPHPLLETPLQSAAVEQDWPQAGWHVRFVAPGRGAHTEHVELQSVMTLHAAPHLPPSTQTWPFWQNVHDVLLQSLLLAQGVLQAVATATRAATQRIDFSINYNLVTNYESL